MENEGKKVEISEEIHVAIHKIRNLQVIFSLWWSGFRKIWMMGWFFTDSGKTPDEVFYALTGIDMRKMKKYAPVT